MSLDNYLTAEHLPQDGPHRADRPMICLDCGHQFNQPQEMSYGSFFPTGKEECPECRSNQIAPENNFRMTKLERKKYLKLFPDCWPLKKLGA